MERVVIGGRRKRAFALTIVLAVCIIVVIALLLLSFLYFRSINLLAISSLFAFVGQATILWFYVRPMFEKEIIVIDDYGLTINGNLKLGPIPWDCVLDATVIKKMFEKHLKIRLTNMSKFEGIFGKNAVRDKVEKNKKFGEKSIYVYLEQCDLLGIDIVSIINEHAGSRVKLIEP